MLLGTPLRRGGLTYERAARKVFAQELKLRTTAGFEEREKLEAAHPAFGESSAGDAQDGMPQATITKLESKNFILPVSSPEHRFGRCVHHHDAGLYPGSPKPRRFGRSACSKGRREENRQLDDDFSVE